MQQSQDFKQELEALTASHPNRKFVLQRALGQGAQGSVFFVKSKNWGNHDQNDFALKQSFFNNVGDSEIKFIENIIQYQNSQNEVTYPSGIIRVFNNFNYNQYYITIMEKGDIDLYSFLNQNRDKQSYEEKLQICLDITRPIKFLHKNNLVHRDVKPEHYIKVGNAFKLIDFGCMRKSTFSRLKTIGVGNPIFQAPEILQNKQNYSDKVDVWALACVFYEIFDQKALFDYDNHQIVKQKILNHIFNQSEVNQKINLLNCNLELKNLMRDMLHPQEDQRLNSDQVLERLLNLKNQPKNIIPFPFQNQANFQQEKQLITNKQQPVALQQQHIGGRLPSYNINPQQFKQIEQKQVQNQFPNPKTQLDEKIEKLEIKLMDEMKQQIQNLNHEILNKLNLYDERQKQFTFQIEENSKRLQEYQTNQEDKNNQFKSILDKLNDQYSNIENKIIKLVNEQIENNNRQIQQQEQNIQNKIQQQYTKEIVQLKLENNKRDQDVQKIITQFQNEFNNKQQIIKQLEQQQENNQQNKTIQTQNISDHIAQLKQSYDSKIQQLEKAQNKIQLELNQSIQNSVIYNNQMKSILEQYKNSQIQEVEATKQKIQIINENFEKKLKKEMELKISQLAETQKDIKQRAKQTNDDYNQYKENTNSNFERQKKEFHQQLVKITLMNDQKFDQFKQDIDKLSQILQTQVENNRIFNALSIDNLHNASQEQKDVYVSYNQILEKLSKTHQAIFFLNQEIIGLEQFTYLSKNWLK